MGFFVFFNRHLNTSLGGGGVVVSIQDLAQKLASSEDSNCSLISSVQEVVVVVVAVDGEHQLPVDGEHQHHKGGGGGRVGWEVGGGGGRGAGVAAGTNHTLAAQTK